MTKQRLLVVDDNLSLIHMVREYTKSSNSIEVLYEAQDGEQGIRKLRDHINDIDLVLLDLIMPNKDGLYFLEEAKKNNINVPIIVVTSFNADEMIRRVSAYNIKYFLLKPFDLKDLEQRVLEATGQIKVGSKENLGDKNLKELDYSVPFELQNGENIIEVTVYNSNGVSEESGVRFVKQ